MTHILAVNGSRRQASRTRMIVEIVADAAKKAGAELRFFDLGTHDLPLLNPDDPEQRKQPSVEKLHSDAAWADAFILGTPEYHGGPSGSIKNWFDHLYPELAGKLAGICAATGGGAGDQSCGQLEVHSRMCHMWSLPYIATAPARSFKDGKLVDERIQDRLERMGHDLVVYGKILHQRFKSDLELAKLEKGPRAGFSGYHIK